MLKIPLVPVPDFDLAVPAAAGQVVVVPQQTDVPNGFLVSFQSLDDDLEVVVPNIDVQVGTAGRDESIHLQFDYLIDETLVTLQFIGHRIVTGDYLDYAVLVSAEKLAIHV